MPRSAAVAPDTPVGIVADATTPRQRVLVTSLAKAKHDADQGGFKAPAIVAKLRGAVKGGKIAGLDLTMRAFNGGEISSRPDSAGNFLAGQLAGHANDRPRVEYTVYGKNSAAYDIPALHALAELVAPLAPAVSPLRTTHLRDPEGPGTTFIVESFIDELAVKAGADPLAFRIAHLRDARQIGVLERVARASDWESTRQTAGRAPRSGVALGRGGYPAFFGAPSVISRPRARRNC